LQQTTAYRSGLTVRRLYRHAYLVIALAAALPRLAALLYERDDILAAYTDKSDDFARTFLDSGTYGFIPGIPSAYTQPLYGFFLIPIYWVSDRHWLAVGLAQIAVAVGTALLVYALGRRVATERTALLAALLTTLHPYLVWHDVHLNRELLDHALAASVVLLALVAAEKDRSLWWAAALGVVLGLAILGNARLILLPIVVGIWLLARTGWAHHGAAAFLVVGLSAALVLAPWVVRNRVSVGCLAVTTDARALWKANNPNTYRVLDRGGWIDDVPNIRGAPPSPQDAGAIYVRTGRIVEIDECAQMRYYRELVFDFWRDHPGEKVRLAAQSARILWQPNVLETEGRPGAGTWQDTARSVVEPAFMIALYALAVIGLFVLPRSFVGLVLLLLAYQTLVAMLFAGATRYRVPWDLLIAIMAAAGIDAIAKKVTRRRRSYSELSRDASV
jgi:4-amino-4-deoxy-L-arabinose transferase-like glycosyltransferase